jgi:hypothetical protein
LGLWRLRPIPFDALCVFWEFAFDFNRKVRFCFAAGEHGESGFGGDFEVEFEGDFFDFGDGKVFKGSDRVLGVALDGTVDVGEFDAHFWGNGGRAGADSFWDVFVVAGGDYAAAAGFDEDVVGGVAVFEDETLGCWGHGKVGADWFKVDNILL